ncbi:MAG: YeaC family protein [Cellvibrionaceae bacterium]
MINSFSELLDNVTPDVYQNLKRAVELGKWPTGERISAEQRQLCLQAVIAYEKKNLPPEKHSGYIPPAKHTHCGSTKGDIADDAEQPLKFK